MGKAGNSFLPAFSRLGGSRAAAEAATPGIPAASRLLWFSLGCFPAQSSEKRHCPYRLDAISASRPSQRLAAIHRPDRASPLLRQLAASPSVQHVQDRSQPRAGVGRRRRKGTHVADPLIPSVKISLAASSFRACLLRLRGNTPGLRRPISQTARHRSTTAESPEHPRVPICQSPVTGAVIGS